MAHRRIAQASILLALFIAIISILTHFQVFTSNQSSISSPNPLMTLTTRPQSVIVVGSGLAGLAAAYSALQTGAHVRLLDRSLKPGGNSIKASSGINGAYTRFQKAVGIQADGKFFKDTTVSAGERYEKDRDDKSGNGVDREGLIRRLTEDSAGIIEWLVDELNVDLSVVTPLGGHSIPRTHRGAGKTPPGAALITAFLTKLKENSHFELFPHAEVFRIISDPDTPNNPVIGVEFVRTNTGGIAWTERLAGPVVFAAGGFAGDSDGMLARYRPDLRGFPATAERRPGALDLLVGVGAVLVDMDSVQIHPTGFVMPGDEGAGTKFLAAEMLRGEGGILLGGDGKRFVDEMELRSVVSEAIMKKGDMGRKDIRLWDVTLLMDPGASEAADGHLGFYLWKGLIKKKKVKELGPEILDAVTEYSQIIAGEKKDPFGRTKFGKWSLKPTDDIGETVVHVGKVTPVVHFTMGGVAFDIKGRVLRRGVEGKLEGIPGLWAAGEITGGIHGDNRLGGVIVVGVCGLWEDCGEGSGGKYSEVE